MCSLVLCVGAHLECALIVDDGVVLCVGGELHVTEPEDGGEEAEDLVLEVLVDTHGLHRFLCAWRV